MLSCVCVCVCVFIKTVSKQLKVHVRHNIHVICLLFFFNIMKCLRRKKKICLFPVTRPTLIFCCDPKVFIAFEDKMPFNESYLWLRFAVLPSVEHKIPHDPHLLPICTVFTAI